MNLDKDELLLYKRLKELSTNTYNRRINTYSNFLNLNEINIFYCIIKELPNVNYILYGGHEDAERRIVGFYLDESFAISEFPISCIKILPRSKKFSDSLNHRDFLGAVLNLGIERAKVGDILIQECEGFLFIDHTLKNFIIDNLTKIKHTQVMCIEVDLDMISIKPSFKEITKTVASPRLDSILSVAFNTSRSGLTAYVSTGKVYVNGKVITSNSYQLKEGDVVSVRSLGKFIYKQMTNQTKKGRYYVTLQKYI